MTQYTSKYAVGDLIKLKDGRLDTIISITFKSELQPSYLLKTEYDEGYTSSTFIESEIKCKMVEQK